MTTLDKILRIKTTPLFLCSITLLGLLHNPSFASEGVAKVMTARGEVVGVLPNGEELSLSEGVWLPEEAVVRTGNRSMARLLMTDQTQMNIAPNSEMKIESYGGDGPGMVELVRGKLRSQVTRNYLDDSDEDRSKLLIKTQNAAMGVRGTDFTASFENNQTGLITHSGSVAFAAIDPSQFTRGPASAGLLDQQLNSPQAVRVSQGQMSSTAAGGGSVSLPIEAPPELLESLNEELGMDEVSSEMEDSAAAEETASSSEVASSENEEETSQDSGQEPEAAEIAEVSEESSSSSEESSAEAPPAEIVVETSIEDSGESDSASGGSEPSGSGGASRIPPGMGSSFASNGAGLSSSASASGASRGPANLPSMPNQMAPRPQLPSANIANVPQAPQVDVSSFVNETINDIQQRNEDVANTVVEETLNQTRTRVQFILERGN